MSFRPDAGPISQPAAAQIGVAPTDGRVTITDARALAAFAHPLRQRLLHHLVRLGPSTASRCADALGDTASNCSYHLRLLSRHGLVERVEGSDGRDRPWRAVASGFDFRPRPDDPESLSAHTALMSVELAEIMQMFGRFFDGYSDLDPQWQAASAFNTYALALTPAELSHLTAVIDLLLRPFIIAERADVPASAREVSVSVQAVLRPAENPS